MKKLVCLVLCVTLLCTLLVGCMDDEIGAYLEKYKDKWFSVENYVKYMTDHMRSLLKREVKTHTVQDFYANSTDIIRSCVLGNKKQNEEGVKGRFFKENGMLVYDVEVLSINIDSEISAMLENHQYEMISKTLELADADAKIKVVTALAEVEKKEADLQSANRLYKLSLDQKIEEEKLAKEEAIKVKIRAMDEAEAKAKQDMQKVLTAIQESELARDKARRDAEVAHAKQLAAIEADKQKTYADTVEQMFKAISPDLIAALTSSANADLLVSGMQAMSPYAIANGESVADTVNTLLRGTSLEGMLDKMVPEKSE